MVELRDVDRCELPGWGLHAYHIQLLKMLNDFSQNP